MIIGTGADSSAAGYDKLQNDIGRALKASQDAFASGANSGAHAFGPLLGVVIAASLLMAAGAAWGVSKRISEYR
jgi:phosphate/sulfate permease